MASKNGKLFFHKPWIAWVTQLVLTRVAAIYIFPTLCSSAPVNSYLLFSESHMPCVRRQVVFFAKLPVFQRQWAGGLILLISLAGCKPLMPETQTHSPLKPPVLSPGSLVLDIFFVRFPFDDEKVNVDLWGEIDEQHFSPECRNRLFQNGFRVGRVGSRIPVELAHLLELGEKPADNGCQNKLNLEDLAKGPGVSRRHLQVQPGRRSEIIASEIYDELPVITKDSSEQICGEVFKEAQAILALEAKVEADGRVRLCLTPEVHHGQPQRRWTSGGQGVMQLDSGRRREVFDALAAEAVMELGDMLVVCSLPNRSGSLGHYFFSESESGKQQQKLLVIRLSQTQHDDLFGTASTGDKEL